MQSLQHAQRVVSSVGCSTSGTAPHPQLSCSARSQRHRDCLHIHRHCSYLELRGTLSVRRTAPHSSNRKLSRLPTAIPCVRADVNDPSSTEPLGITKFVAETCLPTKTGKYRVRGYRHSVSTATTGLRLCYRLCISARVSMACLQIDGGRTVTEPTCIMTGKPEGRENVSDIALLCNWLCLPGAKFCLHLVGCRWWCGFMMHASHQVCGLYSSALPYL